MVNPWRRRWPRGSARLTPAPAHTELGHAGNCSFKAWSDIRNSRNDRRRCSQRIATHPRLSIPGLVPLICSSVSNAGAELFLSENLQDGYATQRSVALPGSSPAAAIPVEVKRAIGFLRAMAVKSTSPRRGSSAQAAAALSAAAMTLSCKPSAGPMTTRPVAA